MTPTAHHHNDSYLKAHNENLANDLSAAYAAGSSTRKLRRAIARRMMVVSAWLSPDTTELIDGHIIILEQPVPGPGMRRAA